MKPTKIDNRIKEIIKDQKENLKNNKCLVVGCNSRVAKNHLLQKKGILNLLADENNKIYNIEFSLFKEHLFFFEKKHFKDSYHVPLFCGEHDGDLFREIENDKKEINFYAYRTQLLFSIRALAYSLKLQLLDLDIFTALSKDRLLRRHNSRHLFSYSNIFRSATNGYLWRDNLKSMIDDYYNSSLQSFEFKVIDLPRIDLCCSQAFEYLTEEEFVSNLFSGKRKFGRLLCLNLIPVQEKTYLILGYHKNNKNVCHETVEYLTTGDKNQILKKLSDTLLVLANHWVCSPKFWKQYIEPNEGQILEIMGNQFKLRNNFHPSDDVQHIINAINAMEKKHFHPEVNLNLFEGCF